VLFLPLAFAFAVIVSFQPVELSRRGPHLETHGPLGTLWVGFGLIAFYLALVWINLVLLPHFLTPLFIIPFTWLMDWWQARKARRTGPPASPAAQPVGARR
jgi:hypothetical protein